jgi:peroxiredoxin family protein
MVAPVGNPAMPMPVPNIIGMLPGMTAMATGMMNGWMKKANVAKLSELLEMAIEGGVKLMACQMSMDVMGIKKEELIDGIEVVGAATFLNYASENAIALSF